MLKVLLNNKNKNFKMIWDGQQYLLHQAEKENFKKEKKKKSNQQFTLIWRKKRNGERKIGIKEHKYWKK